MAGMKKRVRQFTAVGLDRLSQGHNRYEISEPGGLRVVVGLRTKSFFYRYLSPTNGKHRNLHLGQYPEVGLAEARRMVATAKEQLTKMIDPKDTTIVPRRRQTGCPER